MISKRLLPGWPGFAQAVLFPSFSLLPLLLQSRLIYGVYGIQNIWADMSCMSSKCGFINSLLKTFLCRSVKLQGLKSRKSVVDLSLGSSLFPSFLKFSCWAFCRFLCLIKNGADSTWGCGVPAPAREPRGALQKKKKQPKRKKQFETFRIATQELKHVKHLKLCKTFPSRFSVCLCNLAHLQAGTRSPGAVSLHHLVWCPRRKWVENGAEWSMPGEGLYTKWHWRIKRKYICIYSYILVWQYISYTSYMSYICIYFNIFIAFFVYNHI